MTSTDGLFVEPLSFAKVAHETMLGDPAAWEHEITKAIYDKIPFVAKYNTMIQFEQKDENTGYAYGQIIVNNMINIPIIIHPKKAASVLAPLDIFNYNDTWYPLSQERIEEILYDGQVFDRLATKDEQVQPQQAQREQPTQMQGGGREVLASYGSVLDAILPASLKSDVVKFLDKVASDQSIEASFRVHENFDVIRKIARQLKGEFIEDRGNKDLDMNIVSIEKIGSKYDVKIVSDSVYDPISVVMTPSKVKSIFGHEILKTASKEGSAIIEDARDYRNVFVYEDAGQSLTELDVCGDCTLKLGMNKEAEGYLFNNVVDFDMNLMDVKVFGNGEKYAMARTIVGTPGIIKHADFESDEIEDGITGCFMCSDSPTNPVITVPFKMSSIMTKEADGLTSSVRTLDGRDVTITYTPYLESIMDRPSGGYYIPANMKFVKLGTDKITPSSDLPELQKTASLEKCSKKDATLRWTGLRYSLSGAENIVAGQEAQNLTKHAARMALVTLGASIAQADNAINRAEDLDVIKIGGLREVNTKYTAPDKKLAKLALAIRQDTVKLAAALPEGETVDAMLSLNFVTPDNIKIFADYIPTLEESASHLAALLVAVRLGLQEVDEYAVKKSMESLDVVIKQLKDMFSVQQAMQGMQAEQ